MVSLHQLVNDPDDPILSTPEYEFLFAFYKGKWNRHVDREDSMFENMWDFINNQSPSETFFHDKYPILEQVYIIGDVSYRTLWTGCQEFAKKIIGPPDVITWQADMLPPNNTQRSLF